MLIFVEGGKPENPEKNPQSKTRTNNKLNPHDTGSENRTRDTLVGGERSHHCANPASVTNTYYHSGKYDHRTNQILQIPKILLENSMLNYFFSWLHLCRLRSIRVSSKYKPPFRFFQVQLTRLSYDKNNKTFPIYVAFCTEFMR